MLASHCAQLPFIFSTRFYTIMRHSTLCMEVFEVDRSNDWQKRTFWQITYVFSNNWILECLIFVCTIWNWYTLDPMLRCLNSIIALSFRHFVLWATNSVYCYTKWGGRTWTTRCDFISKQTTSEIKSYWSISHNWSVAACVCALVSTYGPEILVSSKSTKFLLHAQTCMYATYVYRVSGNVCFWNNKWISKEQKSKQRKEMKNSMCCGLNVEVRNSPHVFTPLHLWHLQWHVLLRCVNVCSAATVLRSMTTTSLSLV